MSPQPQRSPFGRLLRPPQDMLPSPFAQCQAAQNSCHAHTPDVLVGRPALKSMSRLLQRAGQTQEPLVTPPRPALTHPGGPVRGYILRFSPASSKQPDVEMPSARSSLVLLLLPTHNTQEGILGAFFSTLFKHNVDWLQNP